MEYIYSQMPKDQYLSAMKRKFGNPFYIFDERITGIVIGPFFSVAHYQEYEWNRQITSECNRAWGIVRENHVELEIRFIRGRGLFSPFWLVLLTLLIRAVYAVIEVVHQSQLGLAAWLLSAAIAALVCGITAAHAHMTDKGVAGMREINKFLENPEEYYP